MIVQEMEDALKWRAFDRRFMVLAFDDDWNEDPEAGIEHATAVAAMHTVYAWLLAHQRPADCPEHLRCYLPYKTLTLEVNNRG